MARAALEARCLVVLTAARQWQDESHPRLRFCLSNPYSLISLQRLRFDRPHSDFLQGVPSEAARYRRSASHEIPQAIFCLTGFAKASLYQRLDSLLRSRSCHRSNASTPPGFDFDIRRQTSNVDQALGIHDCLFVEGGDPGGKRINKPVKIGIRQRPIHIAVELGQIAWNVVSTKNYFKGASSSHKPRQSRHNGATRHQPGADFELRQDRSFT